MKLLIGSKNRDKFTEISEIFTELEIELVSGADLRDLPDVLEDADTIEGNAIKKAREMAMESGMVTLADDTGLFVDTLSGNPGVYSARYAGERCSYRDNRLKLLKEMQNKQVRTARFVTVAALADAKGNLLATTTGKVEGEIILKERGNKGFGYDSIFLCHETGLTFAEMDSEQKHQVSHRGRAIRKMIDLLKNLKNNKRSDYGKSKNIQAI